MDIKVNETFLVEIGSTKVHMSKMDIRKLRDKLNEVLGEVVIKPIDFARQSPFTNDPRNIPTKWNFPDNPWYSIKD